MKLRLFLLGVLLLLSQKSFSESLSLGFDGTESFMQAVQPVVPQTACAEPQVEEPVTTQGPQFQEAIQKAWYSKVNAQKVDSIRLLKFIQEPNQPGNCRQLRMGEWKASTRFPPSKSTGRFDCRDLAITTAAAEFLNDESLKCPQGCEPGLWMDFRNSSSSCSYRNITGCVRLDEGFEKCGRRALSKWIRVHQIMGPIVNRSAVNERQWDFYLSGRAVVDYSDQCYQFFFKNNSLPAYIQKTGGGPLDLGCPKGCSPVREFHENLTGYQGQNNDMKPYIHCKSGILYRPGSQSLQFYADVYFWYKQKCMPSPGMRSNL